MNHFLQTPVARIFMLANDRSQRPGLKGDVRAE
jgi:hypothetical protein